MTPQTLALIIILGAGALAVFAMLCILHAVRKLREALGVKP